MEKKRKQLQSEQSGRKDKVADVQKLQAAVGKQLEEASKAVLTAEADAALLGKTQAQEQKRH